MSRRWVTVLALAAALVWIAPTMADKGHGQGKGKGNPHPGKPADYDDGRWEVRDGYEYRTYNRDEDQPPGWSKGKKTGWGNCGMPPGQAKKYGCRSYLYNGRTHYYYRDEQGRIIVRRPVLHDHADERH
jgi:hypothetical protein